MKVTALTSFLKGNERWSVGETKEITQTAASELLAAGLVELGGTEASQEVEVSTPEIPQPATRETKPRKSKTKLEKK